MRYGFQKWANQKKEEEQKKLGATMMFKILNDNREQELRVAMLKIKLLVADLYKLRRVVMGLNTVFINTQVGTWFKRW